MLEPQWTYINSRRFNDWYYVVDYYGPYVIGPWFVLDAQTGAKFWSGKYFRPTVACDCESDVIIATETRSDGPWICNFGIYAIDAKTGRLLWTSHARGFWGKLLRCFDFIPGFTNEFRDSPLDIINGHVITHFGRCLNVRTGKHNPGIQVSAPDGSDHTPPYRKLHEDESLEINGGTICVQGYNQDFVILRRDPAGNEVWRFAAAKQSFYVTGDWNSYRLHGDRIFIVIGDAPSVVPIKASEPSIVKRNPANYQMGILDVSSGDLNLYPLKNSKQRTDCHIESIQDESILVSFDGTQLTQYRIAT